MTPTLITILGPTASGKSALAVALAKSLGSLVISGDAYQIYRGMDIGTAKITKEEMQGVPHVLLDELDPTEPYSAALFCQKAAAVIACENESGRIPILCGGTGLYIQSLLEGYRFLPKAEETKQYWQNFYRSYGKEALADEIRKRRPEAEIPVDPQRRIRLLSLLDSGNGEKPAEKSGEIMYNGAVIGIRTERDYLYECINRRVDAMLAAGLVSEVRTLLERGISEEMPSFRAIGYKEIISYIRGEMTLAEATEAIKQNTRHFAKRQITWYKRMPYIHWIDRSRDEDPARWTEQAVREISALVENTVMRDAENGGDAAWKEK